MGTLLCWSCQSQLTIAVSFWIFQMVSVEECSSFTQNLMQVLCSTGSVILNVTATQYTRSLNGVCRPHWLVQWSCHCSRMCIPVHSPQLSSYTHVTPTILVILTMAGLFLDRPRIRERETEHIGGWWNISYLEFLFPLHLSLTKSVFCLILAYISWEINMPPQWQERGCRTKAAKSLGKEQRTC